MPTPARHLLTSVTTHGHDAITHRAYYLTDRDLTPAWDGCSPPKLSLAKLVRTALDAAGPAAGRRAVVESLSLQRTELGGRLGAAYYWVAEVRSPRKPDAVQVYLTFGGRVIEPEVRVFDHPDRKRREKELRELEATLYG